MKKLFALISLSLITFGCAVQTEKSPVEFPKQLVSLIQSNNYEIEIQSIINLPTTISNKETFPISSIVVQGSKMNVNIPYYDFKSRGAQTIYNFSTFGKMLRFESDKIKITEPKLSKRGDFYHFKINTYGTQLTTFPIEFSINIYNDGQVIVTTFWRNNNVQYRGKIVEL